MSHSSVFLFVSVEIAAVLCSYLTEVPKILASCHGVVGCAVFNTVRMFHHALSWVLTNTPSHRYYRHDDGQIEAIHS